VLVSLLLSTAIFWQFSVEHERATVLSQRDIRWAVLIDEIPSGVFLVDADTGVITYANRSAAEQLGYQQRELVGQNMAMMLPTDEAKQIHDSFWANDEVWRRNQVQSMVVDKCEALTKSGERLVVSLRIQSTQIDGHREYLVLMPRNN